MVRFGKTPEIARVKRLVRPETAIELGDRLLELTANDNPDEVSRYNRTLTNASVRDGDDIESALEDMAHRVFEDDDDAADLLLHVSTQAVRRMSGLRRGGLSRGMYPSIVSLDANRYEPGETFETHTDKGMANDVVAVTLKGAGATFMHVRGGKVGAMPEPDEIAASWEPLPGQAMAIRNHATANEGSYWMPQHAVQNGDEQRVTLQVEVAYGHDVW